jgi:hypothetical protein
MPLFPTLVGLLTNLLLRVPSGRAQPAPETVCSQDEKKVNVPTCSCAVGVDRIPCLQRDGNGILPVTQATVAERLNAEGWTAGELLERLEHRYKFFVLDVRNRESR